VSPGRSVALLDVNVLVALFDSDHVHHDLAHDWFADHRGGGWSTCASTENGFIRVLSQARTDARERPSRLLERLAKFCASGDHVFWPCDVSLRDRARFVPSFVVGARQITDIYLLGLAKAMGGRLATFDRSIPLGAVRGATRAHLSVIGPAE
jgi:uncharacterized protein